MKLADTAPVLYGIQSFSRRQGERSPRFSLPKTQYTYRLILLEEGELTLTLDGVESCLGAGDAVHLRPGSVYRLQPRGPLSLRSLFFDFLPRPTEGEGRAGCVFLSEYDPALASPSLSFRDTALLNESRVFAGAALTLPPLPEQSDPLYPFCARAAILSLLSRLLLGAASRRSPAERLLSYIRKNPEGDLSAAALSARFSYHRNYVNQLVKAATGRSLTAYVRAVKIEHARTLLSEGGLSLTHLSQTLGYYDYSHFYKAFLAEVGRPPSAYLPAGRRPSAEEGQA